MSDDADLPSLEQQVVASNDLETLNMVLGGKHATKESALNWMISNKTEAALRIFDTPTRMTFPSYVDDTVSE